MSVRTRIPAFARFSAEEQAHVDRIVDRTLRLFLDAGVHLDRIEVEMDISAVHARMPLRLADLAGADEFNFAHDVSGIRRHLNRETGDLEHCFIPRFAGSVTGRVS